MSLGVGKYALVMFKAFVKAIAGSPTYPSIMWFIHERVGVSVDGRTCPICGRACGNRWRLKAHIVKFHGDVIDSLIREYYSARMKKRSYGLYLPKENNTI